MVGWLLLRLDARPTYGWELRHRFERHRLAIDPPTLYRTLRKLERAEWLQARWLSASTGPPRRFYRLTNSGRRNLDEVAALIAAIRDMHDAYRCEYETAYSQPPPRR